MENQKSKNEKKMVSKNSQTQIVPQKSENQAVPKKPENKTVPKKIEVKMGFGMRIARHSILEEIKNGGKKNLVLSPLSFHIALNKLASGSTGRTLKQLLYFLESDSITNLNAQSSLLMELATGDTAENQNPSRPMICLVNGIWVDQRFPLKHSFKQLVEDVYKANARSVDFKNQGEQVRNEINCWAREASKGHIYPLLTRKFGKETIIVQANAVYFKGTWVDTFYPDYTRDEDFHLLNGETIRVPFMKKWGTYKSYGSFEGFKLLEMKYQTGHHLDNKRFAMYIFLPDKQDGLQELVEKFNSDPRFFQKDRELEYVKLNTLFVPKLKFEYALDARKSMIELGLDKPYDREKAEIKEMVENKEDGVYVSTTIQKSYIEINEEGTIATSITQDDDVMGFGFDYEPPPEINFVADHPFLFMIKEDVSGAVLFLGAALNPLA